MNFYEPIILFVDTIDEEIGCGRTDNLFKIRSNLKYINPNLLDLISIDSISVTENANSIQFVGKYICILRFEEDDNYASLIVLDYTLRSTIDTEDSIRILSPQYLSEEAVLMFKDHGQRLISSLQEVILTI